MITIKNLNVVDSIFGNQLINDLSITINEHDKIAIIGSEGTGKSTLLKLINQHQLDYIQMTGDIFAPHHMVYIEQNISYQWDNKTVDDFIVKPINLFDISSFRKWLYQFSFDYDCIIDRKIHTFSGGEKVKLALIKGMLQDPDVLLLDEPSNDLDFDTLQFLESFLKNLSIPIVLISHDQTLLENVANGFIHLQHIHKQNQAQTYVFFGTYKDYKERFINQYHSDLKIARKQRSDHTKKLAKFRQIYNKVEHQQNQAVRNPSLARLLKKKIKSLKSQESRFEKEKEAWLDMPEKEEPMNIFFDDDTRRNQNKILLDLTINSFTLPNQKIIKNIRLTIKAKDKIVIYGQNGIGKTSFIKHIASYLDSNHIEYGYIPQNYMDLLDIKENVVSLLLEKQNKYPEYRIRQILSQLGFKRKEMDAECSQLSEGLKLKVLLFLLVSRPSDILLLDEPTRNISPINQDEIYQLFLDYQGAIIAITHDRTFIETCFDDIYHFTKDGLIKKS
jgi:ATPase subunit of ABC transporter with duplicated ATPase domains